MTTLQVPREKRKTLSLRIMREEPEQLTPDTKYVERPEAIYMVYGVGKDMPKRVYKSEEARLACRHAKMLAQQHGGRFYVLRAWRGIEADGND
jgi:hypothetical protein